MGQRGDGRFAVGSDEGPYEMLVSWDSRYADVYLIDVNTGERRLVLKSHSGRPALSPGGKYLSWYDDDSHAWCVLPVNSRGKPLDLSGAIPHPTYDELHDRPEPAPAGDE